MATEIFDIIGLARFIRTLQKSETTLDDLSTPAQAAGTIAAGAARTFTPVDTGALRGSIRSTTSNDTAVVQAGSGLDYARPVHWGAPAYGRPGIPFLSYGAQASEPVWDAIYEKYVNDQVNNVKGK